MAMKIQLIKLDDLCDNKNAVSTLKLEQSPRAEAEKGKGESHRIPTRALPTIR
jgi:hypothetical protein